MTAPQIPDLAVDYRVFTADHDEDAAAARFEQVYGTHPEYVIEWQGKLWVGPCPTKNGRTTRSTKEDTTA